MAVCEALRKFLDDVEEDETGLRIVLSLPSSFDDSLGEAMQEEMRSFFVMNITANGTSSRIRVRRDSIRLMRPHIWRD